MLDLRDNPPMMSPGATCLSELQGRWWVAHTKSRCEKAFAWDMVRRPMGFFLPMIQRVRISGGKKRVAMIPLFPSYVFCCGSEEDRYMAMTTNRLSQLIPVAEQESLVQQLDRIRVALAGKAELDPYPFAAIGSRCRIMAGPFQGLEGVVVQRGRYARFVLEVGILGQGAAIEVDADLLEAVD